MLKQISLVAGAIATLNMAAFSQTTVEENGAVFEINKKTPGAKVDLNAVLSKEKPTLLFVHSDHCGPCKRVAPKIKQLAEAKSDIKVAELMLDGQMEKDIGWESPAAKQFKINTVPAYFIYDKTGKLSLSGKRAKEQVTSWMTDFGIVPVTPPTAKKEAGM
ncbi:MAG: thioredoxin family protein [Candidatus Obscuribacterales bacterium]|nr:thioredoxin family protein [Candidatus Obscuribacterales bacterium]